MNLLYTKKFSKDLDTITDDRKIKDRLLEAIDQLKIAENLSAISGIKKLPGLVTTGSALKFPEIR